MLALMAVLAGVWFHQSVNLNTVVGDTSSEQQKSIEKVSGNTMHQVIDSSITKTNALQAYIADDMFSDVKTDVATLQNLATGLFEHIDSFEAYPFELSDPAKDRQFSAQVLYEEGVDYTQSEYLGVAAHMSETMIAMCKQSDYLDNCFIGLADGTILCVDDKSANKYDENGNLPYLPVREKPWYVGAKSAGELWFSGIGIEADTYTDKIGIECAAPVYKNGELIAVVGTDLFLDAMGDYVNSASSQGGYLVCSHYPYTVFFT